MKNKILVPVDFSPNSINAAKVAVMTASFHDDTVHLLHVIIGPVLSIDTPLVTIKELIAIGESKMEELLKEISQMNYQQEVEIETFVEVGMPIDLIFNKNETYNYDLIVMGTHGASGLKKALIGSVASSVLSQINCPLMLLPKNYDFTPEQWSINQILFSVDDTFTNNKFIVQIENFSEKLKAEINCIQVQEITKDTILGAQSKSINHYPVKELHIEDKSPENIASAIQAFAKQNQMDLIAIVHHKKNLLEKLFKKSVVRELLFKPSVPLLIFKE